jgi:hypothetical protein
MLNGLAQGSVSHHDVYQRLYVTSPSCIGNRNTLNDYDIDPIAMRCDNWSYFNVSNLDY